MRPSRQLLLVLLLMPVAGLGHDAGPVEGHRAGRIACSQSVADEFACQRVDLLAHVSLDSLDAGSAANDLWGWTDPLTGREYVLIGTFDGTVFLDISIPEAPVRLGVLPGHETAACRTAARHDEGGCGAGSTWRDIKVYADHAYVVSEAPGHGMQVFDLRRLRDAAPPEVFTATARYTGFGSAHNLAIDTGTGYAYALGSDTFGGGPHFIDLAVPHAPVAAGGYAADGYSHDAQCLVYAGPDTEHAGAGICLLSNEDTVTILDVSDKNAPAMLARAGYERAAYTHQGWLDDTHTWFYVNDELDESVLGGRNTTFVWDVSDLDNPVLRDTYAGMSESIDHNHFVVGSYLYQSNYTSGLRILDIGQPEAPIEVAWFDSFPTDDLPTFDGGWSNFPFFASGVIALSDIDYGLFLLQPVLSDTSTDLAVSLGTPTQPDPSQLRYRYEVTVTNQHTEAADDVIVSHVFPADVASFTATGATCIRRGRFADCALGTLAGGAAATLTMDLAAGVSGSRRIEVQATARQREGDTRDNRASRTLQLAAVTPPPAPAAGGGSGGGGGAVTVSLLLLAALALCRRGPSRIRTRTGVPS